MPKLKSSKYQNQKIADFDGNVFDSQKEYRRWVELRLLERAGEISDLKRQVPFELIPAQYETVPRYGIKGQRLKDGRKLIEKSVVYNADFTYKDHTGAQVVEDVKSPATRTKDYIIKRKLMLFVHGIRVHEV